MNYEIRVSEHNDYIILTVYIDINAETAMSQNLEAHALGKKLGIKKYLVDLTRSRNIERITDQYQFAYGEMENSEEIDKSARVALVVDKDDHSHDFIETVLLNAGHSIKIFDDREAAKQFLLL